MPKKVRFFLAYLNHYLKKYFLAVILGVCFGSALLTQKNRLWQAYHLVFPNNRHLGSEGIYTIATLPLQVGNQISYGLTTITENDKTILSPIVSHLEIENSNLSYTFTFKDNLHWHNGQKFNASDLDINIPQTRVEVINPITVKITVPSSYSPLLSILSKPLFFKKTLIGLGPYKVKNINYQDGHIKVLRLSSTTSPSNLIYHFYASATDLYTAFKLGEVDEISTSSLENQLQGWQKIKISPLVSTSEYLVIFLNTQKLSSKSMRQAIAYATPKSADKNKRSLGPFSPNSWAYNSQVKPYNFNPTRSKELHDKNDADRLVLTVADRRLLNQAEVIKKSWEEILGLKVELNIAPDQIDFENYDALLTYSPTPIDPDQYPLWHSTQINTNLTHFNNSRIDKLLEEGRQIQDQFERKKIYADFQRFLLEESPAIFLEYPTTYTISRLK